MRACSPLLLTRAARAERQQTTCCTCLDIGRTPDMASTFCIVRADALMVDIH